MAAVLHTTARTAQQTSINPQTRSAPPIDMALNQGTYCSSSCVDILKRYDGNTSFRAYPSESNTDLITVIARTLEVGPRNILVANGSGPLLKTAIPFLIEQKIKSSFLRTARYLLKRTAYPIITPRFTYSKVPLGALRQSLRCEFLDLRPENGFQLDVDDLRARLKRQDGLVYLSNPNNPTGNLLIRPAELGPLLIEFPRSWFFIDEAYLEYLPDHETLSMASLTPMFQNLAVLRSFSFAYGLAAARFGYAVMPADVVAQIEAKLTPHRVGQLTAELAMASLQDPDHLKFVSAVTACEREQLHAGMQACPELEPFQSHTNFILCRVRAPWTAQRVHDALLAKGIRVKIFESIGEERFQEYFRVTVGLEADNIRFLEELHAVFRA